MAEGGLQPRRNGVAYLARHGRAPLCHYVTSPPAARGERKSGRDEFFSSLLTWFRW